MAADPTTVFAVLADPRSYPDWLVGAQEIRHVDASFPSVGAAFHHSVGPTSQTTVDDISKVIAVDPPRRLMLQVNVGPMRGVVELIVNPMGDGSEVRFRERPSGAARWFMPVVRPALHARNAESLRQLEELVASTPDTGPERP